MPRPPGQASVRLHFRAGDLMERDEQNGLAHFIEHMVLNETKETSGRRAAEDAGEAGHGVRARG
jgi:zinc protease